MLVVKRNFSEAFIISNLCHSSVLTNKDKLKNEELRMFGFLKSRAAKKAEPPSPRLDLAEEKAILLISCVQRALSSFVKTHKFQGAFADFEGFSCSTIPDGREVAGNAKDKAIALMDKSGIKMWVAGIEAQHWALNAVHAFLARALGRTPDWKLDEDGAMTGSIVLEGNEKVLFRAQNVDEIGPDGASMKFLGALLEIEVQETDAAQTASLQPSPEDVNLRFMTECVFNAFKGLALNRQFQGTFQNVAGFKCQMTPEGIEVAGNSHEQASAVMAENNIVLSIAGATPHHWALVAVNTYCAQQFGREPNWESGGKDVLQGVVEVAPTVEVHFTAEKTDAVDPNWDGQNRDGAALLIVVKNKSAVVH